MRPQTNNISRRGVVMGVLMAVPFPVFWARLFYLQNVLGQKYSKLAENNRINLRPIQPVRGELLDCNGERLGYDVKSFHLVIIREQAGDVPAVLNKLAQLVPFSEKEQQAVLRTVAQRAPFTPVTVFKNLPFEALAKIQINLPYLPGVDLLPVVRRTYPHGEVAGHILGYTGIPDKEQSAALGGARVWPEDFPVGRKSAEKSLDAVLRGTIGMKEVEVNAHGRELREISRIPAKKGQDVRLSLNLKLQQMAWDVLVAHNFVGSAVVIDVESGELVVAVSHPSYDVNDFIDGISVANWRKLTADPHKPLIHRAWNGLYSPGSTFKVLVAAAAVQEGVVNPREVITCTGKTTLGNRDFHCWKKHWNVNLVQAIEQSCDIYFYEMAKRLGVDKIAHYAHLFGLGEEYGTLLPESTGLVPTRAWKRRSRNQPWTQGEDLITGIGQGFLLATPLQLAVMTARVATGKKVIPTLVAGKNTLPFEDIPLKAEAFAVMHQGMIDVVNGSHGTARKAKGDGFMVAGKTGTAQVVSQRIEEGVSMEDVPYKRRPHGLFICYAPADKPKYAVSVVLEHAGSGGGAAAPVAGEIINGILREQTFHANL